MSRHRTSPWNAIGRLVAPLMTTTFICGCEVFRDVAWLPRASAAGAPMAAGGGGGGPALAPPGVADAARGQAPASPSARTVPKPKIAWRFQAAAPSSGAAAVCEDGSVYLSTVEGYVHALAP